MMSCPEAIGVSSIQDHLEKVLPGACRYFRRYGEWSLAELSRIFQAPGPTPSRTVLEAVRRQTRDLYGIDLAERVGRALAQGRAVLAANHHGLDTHPEMVQGALLFALPDLLEVEPEAVPMVVLACGTVSLRGPTGPGSLMLGRRDGDGRLARVHLFPRSLDTCQVSCTPALTRTQLDDFRRRLKALDLSPWERRAIDEILARFVMRPELLEQPDFLCQAARLNSALWASRFAGASPPLIYLELEAVVTECLKEDLGQSDSPAARLLAEEDTRLRLCRALAGRAGCWSPRLLDPGLNPADLADSGRAWGTVLFWGTDGRGRRHSLALGREKGRAVLRGQDLHLPLAPEPVAAALAEGRLRPGLFLDYLILAGHRLRTYGGIFMVDYLPPMLRITAEILETPLSGGASGEERLAAGPQALRLLDPEIPKGRTRSVGALELLAAGPLTPGQLTDLGRTRLGDLWPFTAAEWYQEEIRPTDRIPGWSEKVATLQRAGDGLELGPPRL